MNRAVAQTFDRWMRQALWWAPPAVLVGLLVALTVWMHGGDRGNRGALERRLVVAESERSRLTARTAALDSLVVSAEASRAAVDRLYAERFSTESARLTAVIREVKALATRAGLDPKTISYPEETFEAFRLSRRAFVFRVDGSYGDLRRFLNLVELSPSFLTLSEIRVGESKGGRLAISLRLSTLFSEGEREDAAKVEPKPAGGAS